MGAIDIAEFDTIEEAMASLDEIERDVAVHELYVDGYWDSVSRPDSGESREMFQPQQAL